MIPIAKRRFVTAAAVLGLLGGLVGRAEADLILPVSATGWYDNTGLHNAKESSYIVGNNIQGSTVITYHNFFVFDLGGVSGPIASATFAIANPITSGITSQTYTNYDVSTPIATLVADNFGSTDIFDDLGTGTIYATTTAILGQTVSVSLNTAALAALNNAEGKQFAIGGALAPLTDANQFIFGSSGVIGGPGNVQLTLTLGSVVPEPSTLTMVCTAVPAALGYWLCRRRRASS